MNDMPRQPFNTFNPANEPGAVPARAPAAQAPNPDNAVQPIGVVLEIAGSGSQIALDLERLNECMEDADPSIALAGQVGSQVKIKTKDGWLLASVRNQRQDRRAGDGGGILANIDFMGEGRRGEADGADHGFRRGVTRYPIPGALVYPATTEDLRQIYASDGRSSIQVGTVYPTKRHPRRALCRCDARQALRAARLDRHRQVDQRGADPAPHLRERARRPHRDDRPARRIFGGVQEHRHDLRRRQPADALLADEFRGALRGVPDHQRQRPAGGFRHPRQVPAQGAEQEPAGRDARQDHRRFADPLSAQST
jgi:hypothetical protein